jgi:hypothetical protein
LTLLEIRPVFPRRVALRSRAHDGVLAAASFTSGC